MRVAVGGVHHFGRRHRAAGRRQEIASGGAPNPRHARALIQARPTPQRQLPQRFDPLHRIEAAAARFPARPEESGRAHAAQSNPDRPTRSRRCPGPRRTRPRGGSAWRRRPWWRHAGSRSAVVAVDVVVGDHGLERADGADHEVVRLADALVAVQQLHQADRGTEQAHDEAGVAAAGAEARRLRLQDRDIEAGVGAFQMVGGGQPGPIPNPNPQIHYFKIYKDLNKT